MKNIKPGAFRLLAVFCLCMSFIFVNGQVQTPRYVSMIVNSNGYYEYLPQGYNDESQTYPLLVFLHGIGELGNGSPETLPNVLRNGPPKLINDGTFPTSFNVNGNTFKFIVISPQFIWWPSASDTKEVIDYCVKKYRVNVNRIYVTGLSSGGGVTWEYGSNSAEFANTVAAIVPVCGALGPDAQRAKIIASANLPVWALHNDQDPLIPSDFTKTWVNMINACTPQPNPLARKTLFSAGWHDAWTNAYDPNYRENNMNVYEWMLQYSRGVSNRLPTSVPTISLPGKIEAEDYVAMNGVHTQNTSDAGGGQNVGWIDNGDWMDYTIRAATAGIYTVNFRVATPNAGAEFQIKNGDGRVLNTVDVPQTGGFQSWFTVSASVSLQAGTQTLRIYSLKYNWNLNWMEFLPAPPVATIPGKFEAENFVAMSGVGTENTSDEGGGKNVGWIDYTDWMDYTLNVTSAGSYNASFRVATPFAGARFQIKNSQGTVLSTVTVPQTGGFQNWRTINTTLSLPAGVQTLRVVSLQSNWNFNWAQFSSAGVKSTSLGASQETVASGPDSRIATDKGTSYRSSLGIFPNPVSDKFVLQMKNSFTGRVTVQIVDQAGIIRKAIELYKKQAFTQEVIVAGGLLPGTYFVRVQMGTKHTSVNMVKL